MRGKGVAYMRGFCRRVERRGAELKGGMRWFCRGEEG